jgi:hypothetical protein
LFELIVHSRCFSELRELHLQRPHNSLEQALTRPGAPVSAKISVRSSKAATSRIHPHDQPDGL